MAEKQDEKLEQEIADVCLTAGRLMIEGGSEMYRVEDTMLRIAKNAGAEDPRVFATPTGIFISINGGKLSQMKQIRDRNINLELVDKVNALSRKFSAKEIDLDDLKREIYNLQTNFPTYPFWLQIVSAAVFSSTLMIMFLDEYDWEDFPAAALVGAITYVAYVKFKKYTNVRFLSEMIAAIVMTVFSIGISRLFPLMTMDNILIGALMTLVPGLAFANALRDLFMGDLLSGIVRMVEAALTAVALGGGVGIVIKFLGA